MFTQISTLFTISIMLIAFGGILQATADTEANKALIVRALEEIFNQGNLDVADEIFAADYVEHGPVFGQESYGPEYIKQAAAMQSGILPDIHFTVEDQIAEGDLVATRWTMTGTHTGEPFMDIPATGNRVTITGILWARIVGGKFVEDWASSDQLGLLQQFGVIPPAPDGPPFMNRAGEDFLWGPPSEVTGDSGEPETNKALVLREVEEIWNQGNLDVVDEVFHPDFINHDLTFPDVTDFASFKQWVTINLATLPAKITIYDIIAEGDKVVARATSVFADPTTGKEITVHIMNITRFADGKIVERWWSKDFLGMIQQMTAAAELEANKALVRRGFEEFANQRNLDLVDEIFATDYVYHLAGMPEVHGPEGVKQFAAMQFAAFPDVQWTIEDMVAEGDEVAVRWTSRGTHKGEFMGIPPTGKQVTLTGIIIERIADGKIVEDWGNNDFLGLLQQFGVIPPDREDFTWSEPSEVTGDPGDPEENKAIIRRAEELWNTGNLTIADEIFATDFVNHDPANPDVIDLESYKLWAVATLAAFPDFHVTVEDMVAEGDKVAARWTLTGTHQAEFAGIPPTGKQVTVTGMTIYRFADGVIVEAWWSYDSLGMLQQLGVIPPLGPPPEVPEEDFSNVFFMSLTSGLNMVSLPLKPITPYTARSFAEKLSATVVIELDGMRQRFVGFTLDAPDDGFDIEGGKGYIVNVPESRVVAFTGAAWTNQPPVEASPSLTQTNGAWAFVVSGKILESESSAFAVTVRNTRTNAVATDVTRERYFATAFADLSRKNVVEVGDQLEVTVRTDEFVSEPFHYTVTPENIRQTNLSITLKNVDIPRQSLLLQNYPNPFNPETWIPYQLREPAEVVIRIHNSTGQLVRTLGLGQRSAGFYLSRTRAAYWNGRNDAGEKVASGTYFYQIKAGNFSATRKMIIVK